MSNVSFEGVSRSGEPHLVLDYIGDMSQSLAELAERSGSEELCAALRSAEAVARRERRRVGAGRQART